MGDLIARGAHTPDLARRMIRPNAPRAVRFASASVMEGADECCGRAIGADRVGVPVCGPVAFREKGETLQGIDFTDVLTEKTYRIFLVGFYCRSLNAACRRSTASMMRARGMPTLKRRKVSPPVPKVEP